MLIFLRLSLFLFIAVIFFQCTTLYQPKSVLVPKLENKRDIEIQVSYKWNNDFNISSAYALSDKDAIMINVGYMNNRHATFSQRNNLYYSAVGFIGDEIEDASHSAEIGFGRYLHNDRFFHNYFGGVGYGYHFSDADEGHTDRPQGDVEGNFVNLFAQYGIGILFDKPAYTLFFNRINYIHTYNIQERFDYWDDVDFKNIVAIEPGVMFNFIISNNIELFGQYAFSINVVGNELFGDKFLNHTKEFSSIGLRIRFN